MRRLVVTACSSSRASSVALSSVKTEEDEGGWLSIECRYTYVHMGVYMDMDWCMTSSCSVSCAHVFSAVNNKRRRSAAGVKTAMPNDYVPTRKTGKEKTMTVETVTNIAKTLMAKGRSG